MSSFDNIDRGTDRERQNPPTPGAAEAASRGLTC